MKILVVDDFREGAYITGRLLTALGHETDLAYDGLSAIEKVGLEEPDIVLLDINMPDMNGYEVCRKIRELPAAQETVIFGLTGMDNEETLVRAKDAGFDDIIIKAHDLAALQEKIESASR